MIQAVLDKIKSQFASLLLKVRLAIEAQPVKVENVHQFLVSFFQDDCSIPEVSDLTKLFNFITEAKLWRYDNYSPLQVLSEQLLPNNESVKACVTDYRNRYNGFCATVNIIEFGELLEEDADDDVPQTFSPEKYKQHYRKLKVKLKLDKRLTEVTLANVNTLWQALAEEFDIPSLTTVIEKIVEGSLIITWLILPSVAEKIRASTSKALKFYQQHNIIEVYINDDILYNEQWMVSF